MKFGVLVFPAPTATTTPITSSSRLRTSRSPCSGMNRRPGGMRRHPCARRFRLWRLPAHRGHRPLCAGDAVGQAFRRVRRTCAGHLQWLPDPLRVGPLPGALMRNAGLKYICKQVHLRTETTDSPFTNALTRGRCCRSPSATWKATTSVTQPRWPRSKPTTVSPSATQPRPAKSRQSQPQRFAGQHCRGAQRGSQRAGHDAAPRPLERRDAGIGRRLKIFQSMVEASAKSPSASPFGGTGIDDRYPPPSAPGAGRWSPDHGDLARHGRKAIADGITHIVCTPHASHHYSLRSETNAERLRRIAGRLASAHGNHLTLGLAATST